MPNWVHNSVAISGNKESLNKLKEQLNQPITKNFPEPVFNKETKVWDKIPATQIYSNPVFSFWNVIAPTDLEAYYGEESGDSAYWWNNRNWGTKWDVAVLDGDKYSNTELLDTEEDDLLLYQFETAWSPVPEIFEILSKKYPELEFQYEYEEEQGWGGEYIWKNGLLFAHSEYDEPVTHKDYVDRGRSDECLCSWGTEDRFADCPTPDLQPEPISGTL